MVTLGLGKHLKTSCHRGSDQDGNSYQNAIGSARKVVRLVNQLDLETSTLAKL